MTRLDADALGYAACTVEMRGQDLQVGDQLSLVSVELGFEVGKVVVERYGVASVSVTPGTYRVVRSRKMPGVGGFPVAVFALEATVVTSTNRHAQLRFPVVGGRLGLSLAGRPYASGWVQVRGLYRQVAKTDAAGWVTYHVWPGQQFELVAVRPIPSGWQPIGPAWSVMNVGDGMTLEAK
ncbi:MAG: hypothetical protein IPK26_14150 [Planctomycetes bacterium]|nr:hypothetical protein [Planctomycetota bacterium]